MTDFRQKRNAGTQPEMKAFARQRKFSYPHPHPYSVYVGAVGNLWLPGAYKAVEAMVEHHSSLGYDVDFQEVPVSFPQAVPDINAVRDSIARNGREYEFVCIIDNDVKPAKDCLSLLMGYGVPIIGPYMARPDTNSMVGEPKYDSLTGLKPMRWLCSSMVLFNSRIFNIPGTLFTGNQQESDFYHHLAVYGFQSHIATDVVVDLLRPPNGIRVDETYDERIDTLRAAFERNLREIPDRG